MSWRTDPYYYPEWMGLELVAQIDYSDGDYCFDYRVVWRHTETGDLYTGRDSGCSCPRPFESVRSLQDLERFSFEEIQNEILAETSSQYYRGDDPARFREQLRELRK